MRARRPTGFLVYGTIFTMTLTPFLRSLAYDVIMRRDGRARWKLYRRQFLALSTSNAQQVRDDSTEKLAGMLAHAFVTVPYYREAWSQIGFQAVPPATTEDLRRLPILTKAVIRERKEELVSGSFPRAELDLDYTGGTTGIQTSFLRNRACSVARFGRQWGILEKCGYRPGDKRGLIWGVHADLPQRGGGRSLRHWFRQYAYANSVMHCTVTTRKDLVDYHERLSKFRPAVLYGYPNAIEQFARFIQNERLAAIKVERIFCTAEKLHDHQRALLQDVFGGEVFNLYASREHGVVGFECKRHRGFHIDVGSVMVEILRDGRPAAPGESGQIVITDLLNYGMPLIRYDTGDLGTAATEPCDCGCQLPTFHGLDGRVADTLYRPDGSSVEGIFLTDLFLDHDAFTQAQFVQEDVTSLDVNLVLSPKGSRDVRNKVVDEVRSIMGPDMTIRVHFVQDIPRNPRSGKFQEVVCKVHMPRHSSAPAL